MVKRAGGALLQSIRIDRTSTRAISSQLTAALRGLIVSGGLKSGQRLPATRTLARELGVARSTVVEAFEQLASEGLVDARVGAGSYVSRALDAERLTVQAMPAPIRPPARQERLARLMTAAAAQFADRLPHEPRAFTTAMPALDAFPMAQWSRLAARHWRSPRSAGLGYNDPLGHLPLRRAIAQHLRAYRGIACDGSRIFVFAGAQQAFQLVAGILIDPGDKVWFEEPGAIGARNSFIVHGADVVPVPVDDAGMDIGTALEVAPDFRVAFVTPSHQQPLGVMMSVERRLMLLQAAESAGAWIVEDDWDGELCFAERPPPTLKAFDAADRVIYVGTFSKSLFPSLRLGFALAPAALVHSFELALRAFSPGAPTGLQAIVADFMEGGHFAAHVRRMRRLYAERHNALLQAASAELSEWLQVKPTTIGLHTVGLLRGGLRAAGISKAAETRGITVAPIDRFCIGPCPLEGLVMGFGGVDTAKIRAGVSTLAEVLRDSVRDRAWRGPARADMALES
jgi:GntR family transcriptional regulator/MocR family aminotransferase